MKGNLNPKKKDVGKLSNSALMDNLGTNNQEAGLLLDIASPGQDKENMADLMKQLVIYQKNEIK